MLRYADLPEDLELFDRLAPVLQRRFRIHMAEIIRQLLYHPLRGAFDLGEKLGRQTTFMVVGILRVNAPVKIGGVIVIPVGAAARAEVIAVSGTSAAGGKGQLSLRLSSVETQWGSVRLAGTKGTQGASNTGGVVLGVLGFGLAGLLTKGGNATFKGGEIITGFIDEGVDPIGEPLQVPTSNPPPLSN